MNRGHFLSSGVLLSALLFTIPDANAYVGPGAGLSAIGAFFALLAAIVLAVLGFLWYPIKRLLRREQPAGPAGDVDALEPDQQNTTATPVARKQADRERETLEA